MLIRSGGAGKKPVSGSIGITTVQSGVRPSATVVGGISGIVGSAQVSPLKSVVGERKSNGASGAIPDNNPTYSEGSVAWEEVTTSDGDSIEVVFYA